MALETGRSAYGGVVAAAFLFSLATGCGSGTALAVAAAGGNDDPDPVAFQQLVRLPAPGTFDAEPRGHVRVSFSAEVARASVTSTTLRLRDSAGTDVAWRLCDSAVCLVDTFAIEIQPLESLGFLNGYSVETTPGILDTQGRPLSNPDSAGSWSFTTRDARWGATEFVSAFADPLSITIDPSGEAVALLTAKIVDEFADDDRFVMASQRRRTGGFGGSIPSDLFTEGRSFIECAASVASDGNVAVVFTTSLAATAPSSVFMGILRRATDTWLEVPTALEEACGEVRVAASSETGQTVLALYKAGSSFPCQALMAVARLEGAWSQPFPLSAAAIQVALDLSPQGQRGIAVWSESPTEVSTEIFASFYAPGSGWGPAARILGVDQNVSEISADVTDEGKALVAVDISSDFMQSLIHETAWSELPPLPDDSDGIIDLDIRFAPDGTPVVVWHGDETNLVLARLIDGEWRRDDVEVPEADRETCGWGYGLDPTGTALVVVEACGTITYAYRNRPGAGWELVEVLTGNSDSLGLAVNARGEAVAIWGEGTLVLARAYE